MPYSSPTVKPLDTPSWPTADALFAGAYKVSAWRRAKYNLRQALFLVQCRQVRKAASQSPALHALFRQQPRALLPVMNHLLDRKLGAGGRSTMLLASVQRMESALGSRRTLELISGRALTLSVLPDGTQVQLSLNTVSYHEGHWALDLQSPDGRRLYTISFGFTPEGQLLIGSVQGPSAWQVEDTAQCVRDLTATAEGMRPAYLLVHVLRACARSWNASGILGIDPVHHVKGRWNHRRSRLRFDYRAFWAEVGATTAQAGRWSIPLSVEQRPLEDVPSKRRAMYRRRYALLAALDASVAQALAGATVVELKPVAATQALRA